MLKLSPPSLRSNLILLGVNASGLVLALLVTGAVAVARRGLDTLAVVTASIWGIGLLIAVYGLLWGRRHARVLVLLTRLAVLAGSAIATLRAWPT